MQYPDGTPVKLGDLVKMGFGDNGRVVCDIDAGDYDSDFPEKDWSYLERGVLLIFDRYGLIHMIEPEDDLKLISRMSSKL